MTDTIQEDFEKYCEQIKKKYKLKDKDYKDISKVLHSVTPTKPVWHIEDLNCFDIHLIEAFISGGQRVYGTAIAPDGYRHSHTWIERKGEKLDLFGWQDHKKEGVLDLSQATIGEHVRTGQLKEILRHLKECSYTYSE